jgi:hypothetical protein
MEQSEIGIPIVRVERSIFLIRGQKVLLDRDLADLYGVETRGLIQAVKRNSERFPSDFMFRITQEECHRLRSQIVISKGRGGPPVSSLCVYGARRSNAFKRFT